ncbi:MAG: hypothetical protein K0S23_1236 [Fluviicola sp.]|jgi:hypothetical protein|uniref:hypothetical protein n=1 Tax=Fluviicola sp. TaxID=1917219 RepID=UPI00260EB17B|nr:hypothetical protein [Fluviicola sp.]MDF3026929.1 hypothetical protein [Fluviicola sp.]
METLKKMLFKLMSQTLSTKEFETWLYTDDYIKSQLLENEMIFELVSINLRSKHAFKELEKFCFNHFDQEECLVQIVKYNCEVYLDTKTDEATENFIRNICCFHDWNNDYSLISQIYYLADDWDLVLDGYTDKQQVKNELYSYAEIFLERLQKLDAEESIQLLRNGIEFKKVIPEPPKTDVIETKSKGWFQFWK